jgi:hypothetical protein
MGWIEDWGSTPEERGRPFPCDALVNDPNLVLFRAVDVAAPPALLFSWLCQLKVAPYSYDWIDNLGRQSPRVRDPANERLESGMPLMGGLFRLASFDPGRHLTLVVAGTKIFGDLAITYQVLPAGEAASRLIAKLVSRLGRWSAMRLALPTGDLIMMRRQLLNFRALAEKEHAAGHALHRRP